MNCRLTLESLDPRDLPSVTVATPTEAFAYVLVNEMRQDPAGFANQLDALRRGAAGAFGFGATDPIVADLNRLLTYAAYPGHYGQALQMLRSTPALGAFGYDDTLAARAVAHVQWMETHAFEHSGMDLPNKTYIPGFNSGYRGGSPDQWGYSGQYYWWGEDIGYTWGLLNNSKAAYTAGRISQTGFQERAAFIDTISYVLEANSPDFDHLQMLLRPDGGPDTGTPKYNAIGMDLRFYEAPGEVHDGIAESTISTHRLGLANHGQAGGFISGVVYKDANGNGAFDAGEGIDATLRFSGPTSFTETVNAGTSQGISSDWVANGTYTVTATAADGSNLGSQVVTIDNANGWFSFRETGAAPLAAVPHGPVTLAVPSAPTGIRPTITWAPAVGAIGYEVWLTNLSNGVASVFPGATSLGAAWSPPADLTPGHTYLVAVRPVFSEGSGAWSTPGKFLVAIPTQAGPTGSTSNRTPPLTWTPVSGATNYVLVFDDLTTNQVTTIRTTSTSWTPPTNLAAGHTYRWWVAARNAANWGLWSPAGYFRVTL